MTKIEIVYERDKDTVAYLVTRDGLEVARFDSWDAAFDHLAAMEESEYD
jgi:hypothetical protein